MAVYTKETSGLVLTRKNNRLGLMCNGVHLPVSNVVFKDGLISLEISERFVKVE